MTIYHKVQEYFYRIPKSFWIVFISVSIAGLLTHMFIFTNALFLGDAVNYYNYQPDSFFGPRWFSCVLQILVSHFQLPWATGVWEIILYSMTAYMLCKIFELEQTISLILCGAVVIMFPVVTASHAYISSGISYAFALFAAIASVYIVEKYKRQGLAIMWATILLVLVSFTYQATLCAAATAMIFRLIQQVLQCNSSLRQLLIKGVRYVLALVVTCILFFFITSVLSNSIDVPVNYRGVSAPGIIGRSIYDHIAAYLRTWLSIGSFYLLQNLHGGTVFSTIACQIIILFGVCASVYIFFKNKIYRNIGSVIFLLLMLLALPVAMYTFSILGLYHHALMRFSLIIPFVFVLWVAEYVIHQLSDMPRKFKKANVTVAALLLCFCAMLYSFWTLANIAYIAMENSYNQSLQLANRVVYEMESTEGYSNDMPVVFIGIFDIDNYPDVRGAGYARLTDMVGTGYYLAYHAEWVFPWFVEEHLGVKLVQLPQEEMISIRDSTYAQEMPTFPEEGYVQIVDGIMLVHLGNVHMIVNANAPKEIGF